MAIALGANRYGKSGIRLATVDRDGERHTFTDLTIDVRLEGAFTPVHTDGNNSGVLPTDTMRGACYALAREEPVGAPESFGLRLTSYLLEATSAAERATVSLVAQPWERIAGDHPFAFTRAGGGLRTAIVSRGRDAGDLEVAAGVADLYVLKTSGSAFSGYLVDRFTTLPPAGDRILATSVTATWRYTRLGLDYPEYADDVRRAVLDAFAGHDDSQSLQHTLWVMGQAVLAACPDVGDIHFSLPNQHHVPADLAPYGLDNPNRVFVATDRPFGVIEGTVTRNQR
jgi:urate oxidase